MKSILVGDLHIGINESDENFLSYQKKSLEWIIKESKRDDITNVIFLGDIFDNRKALSHNAIELAQWFFEQIEPKGIMICVGNHDTKHKNTLHPNWITLLLNKYSVADNTMYDSKNLWVSWINESNHDTIVDRIKESKCKYLFGHFELAGFKMLKGVNSQHDQIDRELLKKFKKVISGHYHCYSEKGNITYLGAPYEMNWGDCDEDKFIGVFDDSNGKLELLRNPNNYHLKIDINDEEYLGMLDSDSLSSRNIKLFINCEQTIKMNKKLQEMTDKIINLDITDNFMLESFSTENNVTYNGSVIELWNEYVETEELDNKEDIVRIFEEEYKKVIIG